MKDRLWFNPRQNIMDNWDEDLNELFPIYIHFETWEDVNHFIEKWPEFSNQYVEIDCPLKEWYDLSVHDRVFFILWDNKCPDIIHDTFGNFIKELQTEIDDLNRTIWSLQDQLDEADDIPL